MPIIFNQLQKECEEQQSLVIGAAKIYFSLNNISFINDINIAIEYIKTHLNTPIQIMDIVCYVGISRTNLLNKFKKETNETIGNYIMKCRLEKSKMLLKYSNISLGEISNYLCFSSQSYFQNKFKQMFKITPLKYRKEKTNKK